MKRRQRSSESPGANRGERGDETSREYRARLGSGGELSVLMPAALAPDRAIEVVDQLRQLAQEVAVSAGLTAVEDQCQRELFRAAEQLLRAPNPTPLPDTAGGVVDAYRQFLDAVVECLRSAER